MLAKPQGFSFDISWVMQWQDKGKHRAGKAAPAGLSSTACRLPWKLQMPQDSGCALPSGLPQHKLPASTGCAKHHRTAGYGPGPRITRAAAVPLPSLLPRQARFQHMAPPNASILVKPAASPQWSPGVLIYLRDILLSASATEALTFHVRASLNLLPAPSYKSNCEKSIFSPPRPP